MEILSEALRVEFESKCNSKVLGAENIQDLE